MPNKSFRKFASKINKIFLLFLALSFFGCNHEADVNPYVIGEGQYTAAVNISLRDMTKDQDITIEYKMDNKPTQKTTVTLSVSDYHANADWDRYLRFNGTLVVTAYHPKEDLSDKDLGVGIYNEKSQETVSYHRIKGTVGDSVTSGVNAYNEIVWVEYLGD